MDDKDIAKLRPFTGERWSSDPGTVERRDRERPETGTDLDDLDIVNRTGAAAATPRRYEQPDTDERK